MTVLTARTDGTPASEPRCFSANDLLATISAAAPSEVAQMSSCRSGSDTAGHGDFIKQAGGFLAVAGIRVLQAVTGVLHLDLGEVFRRRTVEVHAAAGQQREVDRVHRPDQVEALPVGVVLAFPAHRGEGALGRGVGADHQCDVAEAGQDVRAGALQRL